MSNKTRHREEVINVKLADELAERGLDADAESIEAAGRPDVLIDISGIKLVIEGRHEKAKDALIADAENRIRKGIGDIALAVHYRDELYTSKSTKLSQVLAASSFSGAVLFHSGVIISRNVFHEVSLDNLADIIRNTVGLFVRQDVVSTQVEKVENAIEGAVLTASRTNLFFKSNVVRDKLKKALAIEF